MTESVSPPADLASRIRDWYERHFETGWMRAWSAWAASGGLGAAFGPDVMNEIFERWTQIAAIPEANLERKLWLCAGALVLVLVLRPIRQSNMPPAVEAVVRLYVPRVIQMETARGGQVGIAAQVIPVDAGQPMAGAEGGRVL